MGPCFIGISSETWFGLAIPGMSHYIATKMGIIGFMRGLANDVASDGITSNAVLPGLTNTLAIAPQSEEQKRATWEQQAIKRLGEPEDITGAILFLTSDDAAFITGQAIVVDGGQYSDRLASRLTHSASASARRAKNAVKRESQTVALRGWVAFRVNHGSLSSEAHGRGVLVQVRKDRSERFAGKRLS